jgi:ferric-dicitrate binding protein FerR (iron transport regulator)
MLASIFGCLFLFSPVSQAAGEAELGRVLYAHAANLRGMPAPGSETILSGDVLTTSEDGSALVELKSGAKLKTEKGSSVRFLGDGETVQAELLSGTVVSESAGKPTMVVTTPQYQFAPAQEEECRYVVQLSKEAIVAGAIKGNILVKARNANGSYVLHQGNYAAISASAAEVPGQATQAVGQADERVGTVSDVIPDGVVQRKGQGAETALKVNDGIYREDVVRTLQNGRLRIALADGSSLSFGTGSNMELIGYDPRLQQTQIKLNAGEMRARVLKLIREYSSFKVQTPTAAINVAGADFIVEAQPDKTGVYSIEGMVSVQNIAPDIAERVTLRPGEYTSVAPGLPPSAPMNTPNPVLQSQINQTTVGPTAGGLGGQAKTTPAGWHIGSLSEAASIGLVAGIGAGAAVAVAIPAMSHHAASPSAP